MLFRTADMPLSSALDEYRACFSKPQFRQFKTFVSGLMLNGKNEKNIMDISSSAMDGRSQSCLNRFLHGSKWSRGCWTISGWICMRGARRAGC
jgi:hypothetical protein